MQQCNSKMYFKITNKEECHKDFKYKEGLNKISGHFYESNNIINGLYFTDAQNILTWASYGCYLREVYLPTDNPDFKMVPGNLVWRANMIILGKRMDLYKVSTIQYLIEKGADIQSYLRDLLINSIKNSEIDLLKFLVRQSSKEAIKKHFSLILKEAMILGNAEIIKYVESIQ